MYAVDALPGVAEKIPSVIHVDNTCRIQTVTPEQNEHYYNLIDAFEKLSEVPILFNTSFNLGGDPLVEQLEDAIDTLERCAIDWLYLPEIQKLVNIPQSKVRKSPKEFITEVINCIMRTLSVNLSHDASVTLIEDGKIILHQLEEDFHIKNTTNCLSLY